MSSRYSPLARGSRHATATEPASGPGAFWAARRAGRRTSRRLRDVPSSRFTRHRPSGATLQRRFGGSASNAPREQPTGNLDGRRVKCSTMMAAALHGQNENYPPTHIPKSTRSPFFCAATPYNYEPPLAQRPERKRLPGAEGPPEGITFAVFPLGRRPGSGALRLLLLLRV